MQAKERKIALEVQELEERIAPTIVTYNPAGNSPQGSGALNGQNVDAFNPAGHTPPGQQTADSGAGTGA